MEDQRLKELIQKYLDGTANDFEKRTLDEWYRLSNGKEIVIEVGPGKQPDDLREDILRGITEKIKSGSQSKIRSDYGRSYLKIAAISAGILLTLGYLMSRMPQSKTVSQSISVQAPVRYNENKYVTLPDSSVVLLKHGSQMTYQFNGKIRIVKLTGEAYFDVRHQKYPFVIHTGKITTTVLGTAFNIEAYPGKKVTVSVTRGKVGVTDNFSKKTAMLLPNQQATYLEDSHSFKESASNIPEILAWAKNDMEFDDMPFKQLADRLSRRYNVTIEFEDPELEKELISGRFTGTESLQEVLKDISKTMSCTYGISGDTVIISQQKKTT